MAGRSILFVDDDEGVLRTARLGLARDAHVVTATTAAAGLGIARAEHLDAVVVDHLLGADTGLALVAELKRQAPARKVLVWSGYASVATTVAAMRAGADDVRPKPIAPRAILRWLDTGSWATPAPMPIPSLERMQWEYMHRVVEDCGGNLSEAARALGIERATLRRHLRKPCPPR